VNFLSALLAGITEPRLTLGTFGPLPMLRLPLNIRRSQANTHWHIIGTSGSGKSFFLAQLFLSLLKQGSPVTLIDPHGDLAKLVLTHLVGQGRYKNTATYERIIYLDLPAAEQQGRFLPFNPLLQELPAHTMPATSKKSCTGHFRNSPKARRSLIRFYPGPCGYFLPITCPSPS
jgi:Helicase HerA, central domain